MGAGARQITLVDTSAAIALTVADHEQHEQVRAALAGRRLELVLATRDQRAVATYRAPEVRLELV